jgi:type IV secretory pathway VirD2 relaxase
LCVVLRGLRCDDIVDCTKHKTHQPPKTVVWDAGRGAQRQRSQNLTSASGDAIWGAHRHIDLK